MSVGEILCAIVALAGAGIGGYSLAMLRLSERIPDVGCDGRDILRVLADQENTIRALLGRIEALEEEQEKAR